MPGTQTLHRSSQEPPHSGLLGSRPLSRASWPMLWPHLRVPTDDGKQWYTPPQGQSYEKTLTTLEQCRSVPTPTLSSWLRWGERQKGSHEGAGRRGAVPGLWGNNSSLQARSRAGIPMGNTRMGDGGRVGRTEALAAQDQTIDLLLPPSSPLKPWQRGTQLSVIRFHLEFQPLFMWLHRLLLCSRSTAWHLDPGGPFWIGDPQVEAYLVHIWTRPVCKGAWSKVQLLDNPDPLLCKGLQICNGHLIGGDWAATLRKAW